MLLTRDFLPFLKVAILSIDSAPPSRNGVSLSRTGVLLGGRGAKREKYLSYKVKHRLGRKSTVSTGDDTSSGKQSAVYGGKTYELSEHGMPLCRIGLVVRLTDFWVTHRQARER